MLINEHPIGAVDGANTAFQTTNGGRDFTLEFAPLAGDQIVATYRSLFP